MHIDVYITWFSNISLNLTSILFLFTHSLAWNPLNSLFRHSLGIASFPCENHTLLCISSTIHHVSILFIRLISRKKSSTIQYRTRPLTKNWEPTAEMAICCSCQLKFVLAWRASKPLKCTNPSNPFVFIAPNCIILLASIGFCIHLFVMMLSTKQFIVGLLI